MLLFCCLLCSYLFILCSNYFLDPFRSPFPYYLNDEVFTIIIDILICLLVTLLILA